MTGTLTARKAAAKVLPEAYRGVLVMPFSGDEMLEAVRAALEAPCPDCHGSGEITLLIQKKPCRTCGGTGRVRGGRR